MTDGEREERLGEIIRRQRELNALSMRQFAGMVGISNPYLSQIERGLREPSEKGVEAIAKSLEGPAEKVGEAIAKSLGVSAEALYQQAGLEPNGDDAGEPAVVAAIRDDPAL